MKTEYKHIYFEKESGEPELWLCKNNRTDDWLGEVSYYKLWNRFVFTGYDNAVFDTSCLKDIIDFINQLRSSD